MGSLLAGPIALWLPILVSAVIVFIASSIVHMGPFWHRKDFPAMPREDPCGRTLRSLDLPADMLEDITWHNTFRFLGIDAPQLVGAVTSTTGVTP